jgi:four helix bundle protein
MRGLCVKSNIVLEKSYDFAVLTIRFCRACREPGVREIIGQFLDAGTSIGANVEEAVAGQSRRDFLSKMSIARKESRESHYWLRLFSDSDIGPADMRADLLSRASELVRILTSIVKSTKGNEE